MSFNKTNKRGVASRMSVLAMLLGAALTPDTRAEADALRAMTQKEVDQAIAPALELQNLVSISGGDVEIRRDNSRGTVRQMKGRRLHAAVRDLDPGEQGAAATAKAFVRANGRLLGVADPDVELSVKGEFSDPLGGRHVRFQQSRRGIPVWPSQLNVHLDAQGNVESMDGSYIRTPSIETTPTLSVDEAKDIAESSVGASGGSAERAELIVFVPNQDGAPHLAFKVSVHGEAMHEHWTVIVDAMSGDAIASFSGVCTAAVQGSGQDLFGITRSLNVLESESAGLFYMFDTTRAGYDPIAQTGGITILDAQNTSFEMGLDTSFVTSNSANSGWLPDSVSAMFGLAATLDYYDQVRGRNSLNGNGGLVRAVVRYGQGYGNAHWDEEYQAMFFGDAIPFAGALDVVAHELTHGVTNHESNLVYQFQSGALNEAMSDIFGEVVERFVYGENDWLKGADIGAPFQDYANPNAVIVQQLNVPHPDRMSQFINVSVEVDQGGVHANSAIINHCFYLLAEGGEGAIGMDDAADIFYRANTVHLGPNADFVDARLACIQSAEELFGEGSQQARMTAAAFDAVEIFDTGATGGGADNGADDDFEENDTLDQAAPISAGTHSLQGLDDDYFLIEVTGAGRMEISIAGPSGDLDLGIYDSEGALLEVSEAQGSNEGVAGDVTPGVFVARVLPYQGQTSAYTLTLTLPGAGNMGPGAPGPKQPTQSDDAFEENDTMGAATPITPGSLDLMGMDPDFFTFDLASDRNVTITVRGPSGDLDLCLVNANGAPMLCSENAQTNEQVQGELPAGSYFIAVVPYEPDLTSSYTLTLAIGGSTTDTTGPAADGACGTGAPMMVMAMAVGMVGLGATRRRRTRRSDHACRMGSST
ncbi:MAG: M4 family metallopeptidase [Phycisphaerales bacterium]|nr:M4 family metallopeptidase [Phycisphaerales bacterium]